MPIFFSGHEPQHVGLVLEDRERNFRDDSDFYAIVWDAERAEPREVEYDTTRFGGGGHCRVDATEEVRELYREWRRKRAERSLGLLMAEDAATPDRGKFVRVVKGRKVPIGTEGVVTWYGDDAFDRSRWYGRGRSLASMACTPGPLFDMTPLLHSADRRKAGKRVKLLLAGGGEAYTSATNVEVLGPARWFVDETELRIRGLEG